MPRQEQNVDKLFLNVSETAQALGLGETLTKQLIREGRLRSVLIGRRRLVHVEQLRRFAEQLAAEHGNDEAA